MDVSHQRRRHKYPDVLAGIVSQLREDHQVLLNSLVDAEQMLLSDLERGQKQTFLRYRELLDELHTLYQLAAYEAGRRAAADIHSEALAHVIRALPGLVPGEQKQAESRTHVPANAQLRS